MQCINVFDDIMQGLNEVAEYQKGNLELKTIIVTDDDLYFKFNRLTEADKQVIRMLVDRFAATNNSNNTATFTSVTSD